MTTTTAPDLKPDHTESEEWPTLDRDPAHATRDELNTHPFDPTQGRKIGADPYDDPTHGRKLGSDPYDDPTHGRKIGSDPYDDPTRARSWRDPGAGSPSLSETRALMSTR